MQTGHYPEVPPDFGNWLAGLFDGEGCFLIHNRVPPRRCCNFYAKLTLRDDETEGLLQIRDTTGIGRIWHRKPVKRRDGYKNRPTADWIVQTKPDAGRLVEIFDEYPLRMKKARDYAIWREAVLLWMHMPPKGYHRIRHDWAPIRLLAEQLKDVRAYEPQLIQIPAPVRPPPSLF